MRLTIFEIFELNLQILTSTNPWEALTRITRTGCAFMAAGTNRLRKDEMAMAVPKIRLAGKMEAKKPPGTWVIK